MRGRTEAIYLPPLPPPPGPSTSTGKSCLVLIVEASQAFFDGVRVKYRRGLPVVVAVADDEVPSCRHGPARSLVTAATQQGGRTGLEPEWAWAPPGKSRRGAGPQKV